MLQKIDALLAWLNGKKTAGGFLLMVAADIAEILECPAKVVKVLAYAGMALGGFGLAHKGVKAAQGK